MVLLSGDKAFGELLYVKIFEYFWFSLYCNCFDVEGCNIVALGGGGGGDSGCLHFFCGPYYG